MQSRTDAGLATQPPSQHVSTIRGDDPLTARDPPPHLTGSLPFARTTTALYSQVVASRSPSPRREDSTLSVMPSAERPSPVGCSMGRTIPDVRVEPAISSRNREPFTSPEEGISPEDSGEAWTTVRR